MSIIFKNKVILLILFLALILRLAYVLFCPQLEIRGDAQGYDQIAVGLIEKGEFLEWKLYHKITRPPLYPLFLAGSYFLFGHNYLAVRLWQCLFGALTVLFVYLICTKIFKTKKIPLLAATLAGLHPALISYTGLLYTETLFNLLLVVAIYFLQKAVFDRSYLSFSLSGALLGLTALTSSRITYFPFLFLLPFWFLSQKKTDVIKQWIVLISFMFITISPWTIRNYLVSGKFILLENYHKAALWFATNPYDVHEWDKEQINQLIAGKTPAEAEQAMYEEGKRHLREHPFIYLKNSFRRFFRLWVSGHSNIFYGFSKNFSKSWELGNFRIFIIKFLLLGINLSLLAFGFYGILLIGIRQLSNFYIILSPIIYLCLLHTFTVAAPRLSIPMLPFVLIFSAIALDKYVNLSKNR